MTRTTADREHTHPSRQRGLPGLSERLSHSPAGLRLCVSSRAPSRAGSSPYTSEPSIEAPDSTTTSRRIRGETPAITHHPHHQALAAALRDRHPKRRANPPRRLFLRPAGPHRGGCKDVGGGRCWCPRSWPPTLVTGRKPGLLRFRSRFSPAVAQFSRSRGSRAARHLNRSLAFRRHLRSRSVKTCNYGGSTRIRTWS